MPRHNLATLIFLILATAGLGSNAETFDEVQAANSFGIKSFQYVLEKNAATNVAFSPLSAHVLLGMLLNGADGHTADEISRAIGVPLVGLSEANQKVLALVQNLGSRPDGELKLTSINATWIRASLRVNAVFSSVLKNFYMTDIGPLQSESQVNEWVGAKTNGQIKGVAGDVSGLDMIFANATYFKADWTVPFIKVHPGDFFPEGGGGVLRAQMMDGDFTTRYLNGTTFEALELPYGPNRMASMIVVLPAKGIGMKTFRSQISSAWYEVLIQQLNQAAAQRVSVEMPKASGSTDVSVVEAVGSEIFTNGADFGKISDHRLVLSSVTQGAVVHIDQFGSEATAVSAGHIEAVVGRRSTVEFVVNRPFYYFIRDNGTGALLLCGQVAVVL